MTFVFWVWRPGVSVCESVCDGAEGVIRRHCDCYEEDMYVQKDIGGFIQCSLKPGLGPYAECTEITDLSAMRKLTLIRTATGKEDPELPLLRRISSLELPASEMKAQINASQSSSSRLISTSTVQRTVNQLSVTSQDLSGMDLGFWTGTGQILEPHLTSLILHNNHLTEITTDQFSCMPLLERLDLSENHISSLAHQALQGMPLLRVLDLTHNKISLLGEDDFEGLPALEFLLLKGNKISGGIAHGVFRRQHRLQDLSLGEIDIIYQLYLNMLFLGFPTKLQNLLINTGPGTYLTVGHVPAPEFPMVLELRGKMIQSSDCENNMFPMVRELKVGEGTTFDCSNLFLAPYFLDLESFEFSANPEKVATPYTTINQLRKLKRLKLTNLNFSTHTDPSVTFRNLTELRSLVLINCRLNFLTRVLTSYWFGESLPFRWLWLWLILHAESQFDLSVSFSLPYQRLNFLSTMERLCQTEDDFLSYVSTTATVCTLLCLALGYSFLRWPCVVLFFHLRGWVERRVGRRMGEQWEKLIEVRYDEFVSFSSRDMAWVLGEMVCVWKGIVDNIAENIYCSRRTVCVLTRRYLRSDWCGLEMRVATHRLLSERSHRLILIFLEHISPFELSAFHRLAKLARTRTYLDWPQDEDERVTFWEHLRQNITESDTEELHDPPEAS
uniref:TIR domain-containing protein n=1 Tax=Oncorhynchus mykiss TaxID=8022 RepID=A0A8K9UCL7_ONCMY